MDASSVNPILETLKLIDSFLALGLAVWMIVQGMKRFDVMQEISNQRIDAILQRHEALTLQVLEASAARNDQLMSLVSTLCAQPTGSPSRKE